jgi:tetratricopeptide (TPR) repeat protein
MWSPARIVPALALCLAIAPAVLAHGPVEDRVRELSRDIARDPSNIDLILKRAGLYEDLGLYAEALADFERVVRLEPSRHVALLGRAVVLLDVNQPAQALEAIDEFLAREPDQATEAWRVRAHCLMRLQRVDDAIDSIDRAIAMADPPVPDDYLSRARWIASLGESHLDDAVAGLDEGLARLGPSVSLQLAAIEIEQQRGGHDAVRLRTDEMHDAVGVQARDPDGGQPAVAIATLRSDPEVTRGPYLQIGTETSVVIRWRTDIVTDSRVTYGTDLDSLDLVTDDSTQTTEHVVTLAGLTPATRYYYSIGTTALVLRGGDANHYFDTAPPLGTVEPIRIWVIGDAGTKGLRQAGVRNAYRNHPGADDTDVWLMLGDNAYEDGTDAEYQAAVFNMYPTFLRNTVLWSTRGNHELLHAGYDYYDIFSMPTAGEAGGLGSGSEAYYSFDYANVHFICLDSQGSDRSPGGAMMTWLAQDVAATTQTWIIAFWHHPPYSKGSHDSDTELRLVQMRTNAVPILEGAGVDLVLAGHSHSYERSFLLDGHYGLSTTLADSMKVDDGDGRPDGDGAYRKPESGPQSHNGAVYTVAGTSGSVGGGTYDHPVMISSLARLGSLVLDIDGNEMKATFIDTTGAPLDSFVVSKTDPPTAVRKPRVPALRFAVRPNPFESRAHFDYDVASSQQVTLDVYNVRGQHVRTVLNRRDPAGSHTVTWDARDNGGQPVAQGVYFAVLRAGADRRTTRLVLVR